MSVSELHGSGRPAELLNAAGIDAAHIAAAAAALVGGDEQRGAPACKVLAQ